MRDKKENEMRLFLVVKDETEYDGDRTYPRVFKERSLAETFCNWEREKAEDWYQSMIESGERVGRWVPSFHIEETVLLE